ncbi:hypothetical protein M0R45_036182 [Rubus argutus]|uniref:Uncharacterized protein n=1 Tax=Rubus argutus TaxID=59490 RepID=A0AAW1VXZ7_RUBAR
MHLKQGRARAVISGWVRRHRGGRRRLCKSGQICVWMSLRWLTSLIDTVALVETSGGVVVMQAAIGTTSTAWRGGTGENTGSMVDGEEELR